MGFAHKSQEAYAKALALHQTVRAERDRRVAEWKKEYAAKHGEMTRANHKEWVPSLVDFETAVEKELKYWDILDLLTQAENEMIEWAVETTIHLAKDDEQKAKLRGLVKTARAYEMPPRMRESLVNTCFYLNPKKKKEIVYALR